MAKKKDKKEEASQHVNEPEAAYGAGNADKTIRFFSSFEGMEEDNYKWLASLTPEEHLQNGTALIKRIFAGDLKRNPNLGTKLSID